MNRHLRQDAPVWVLVGALGVAVITAIGFRWISAVARPADFGKASLLYGGMLLASACSAGVGGQGIMRLTLDAATPQDRADIWSSTIAAVLVAALVVWLVLIMASGWRGRILQLSPPDALALGLAFVAEGLKSIGAGQLTGLSLFRDAALAQLVDAVGRPLAVVGLSHFGWSPVASVLGGYALGASVAAAAFVLLVHRHLGRGRVRRRWLAAQTRYGWPLVGNGVFGWLANSGDRYVVAAVLDLRAAGIYVAAINLGARPAMMLGGMIETYLRPRLYRAVAASDRAALVRVRRRWLRDAIVVLVVNFALLWMLEPWLVRLLLAPAFRDGAHVLVIVGFLAYAVLAIGYLPQRINYALGRTFHVALVEIIGTLVMLAGVFLGGRMAGLSGVAIGLLLACTVRACVAAVFARRGLRMWTQASMESAA